MLSHAYDERQLPDGSLRADCRAHGAWLGAQSPDRIARPETAPRDGANLQLISLDSTIHSIPSVGPPPYLAIYCRNAFCAKLRLNVSADDEYFKILRSNCNETPRQAFRGLPDAPWGGRRRGRPFCRQGERR
jgi:predicted proteasome-type protease